MKEYTGFSFEMYTEILFGRDSQYEVANMIRKYGGKRVMLVYGGGSVKRSGLYDIVKSKIAEAGLYLTELGGVRPNPRRSLVEEGIRLANKEKVDFLLGVGGGSAIDTAKAVALGIANDGEYWKFYQGKTPEKMAPVGVINTIAAAGSETSRSSVLLDDIETDRKYGFLHDVCRPVFAIMNPELTYTVSPFQTAAGATDILAHTVNRYFIRSYSRLGDEFAEGLMRTVVQYAESAIEKPDDYEARAELMLAGSFSHNDLMGIGRSGDRKGSEHALEEQLSAAYDTAHGAGLAVVMPAWLQYIADYGTPDQAARVAQFAVNVFGVKPDLADIRATADEGLRCFRHWLKTIGMPVTLKELGVPDGEVDQVIARCVKDGEVIRGFMDLDRKAVEIIFRSCAG